MALNKIFQSTQSKHRARTVPSGTVAGTPLLSGSRPAVALTDRGDATRTQTDNLPAGLTSISWESGGVGLKDDQATLAFDGTFEFAVTGATTSTGQDVPVYITSAGALTLTATSNTLYGATDYPEGFKKIAGRAPVRIGA